MAYIEAHQSLRDHRKILALAAELDMPEPHVAGHCLFLWLWSLDNAVEGVLPTSERIIERAAGCVGKPGALVAAMARVGMLDRCDDGALAIHDWWDYAHLQSAARGEWDAMRSRVAPVIYERDQHQCVYCGNRDDLTIDHVIPIAFGGSNEAGNLVTACRSCNSRKGTRSVARMEVR
jgi:hypothetical protein